MINMIRGLRSIRPASEQTPGASKIEDVTMTHVQCGVHETLQKVRQDRVGTALAQANQGRVQSAKMYRWECHG